MSELESRLDVRIWITPEGQLMFHQISEEVIELAYAIAPDNPEVAMRYQQVQQWQQGGSQEELD